MALPVFAWFLYEDFRNLTLYLYRSLLQDVLVFVYSELREFEFLKIFHLW